MPEPRFRVMRTDLQVSFLTDKIGINQVGSLALPDGTRLATRSELMVGSSGNDRYGHFPILVASDSRKGLEVVDVDESIDAKSMGMGLIVSSVDESANAGREIAVAVVQAGSSPQEAAKEALRYPGDVMDLTRRP